VSVDCDVPHVDCYAVIVVKYSSMSSFLTVVGVAATVRILHCNTVILTSPKMRSDMDVMYRKNDEVLNRGQL